ncbi:MAG: hypothetical protein IPO24_07530 [Bacteroidetes bacterium]|nr:hypothetical protein [Bacteroidota bacterium]
MKRLILPVLLAAGMLLSAEGYGQQAVKVDQNFNIQLTDDLLQQKFVQLDISGLSFKDEATATKYFNSIENNLVEFVLNYEAKTATMMLYPDRLGKFTYTLEDWNKYIATMSQRCSSNYNSFLNQ